jgi:hypothetical protein
VHDGAANDEHHMDKVFNPEEQREETIVEFSPY